MEQIVLKKKHWQVQDQKCFFSPINMCFSITSDCTCDLVSSSINTHTCVPTHTAHNKHTHVWILWIFHGLNNEVGRGLWAVTEDQKTQLWSASWGGGQGQGEQVQLCTEVGVREREGGGRREGEGKSQVCWRNVGAFVEAGYEDEGLKKKKNQNPVVLSTVNKTEMYFLLCTV